MKEDKLKTVGLVEFADVLEQLETQFYTQALAKFQASDFTAAGFADPNVPIQQFQCVNPTKLGCAKISRLTSDRTPSGPSRTTSRPTRLLSRCVAMCGSRPNFY